MNPRLVSHAMLLRSMVANPWFVISHAMLLRSMVADPWFVISHAMPVVRSVLQAPPVEPTTIWAIGSHLNAVTPKVGSGH
jgi:hypothetical protein